jgi:uncharacterized protein
MSSDNPAPLDPAVDIALSPAELDWLADVLASQEVPDTAMPLEALDGFFTALAAGPEPVGAAEYMPVIWDTAQRNAPVFSRPDRLDILSGLLTRHRNGIERRLAAGYPHIPLLEDERPGQDGCAWSYGFMVGIALRLQAWQPLLQDREMEPLIAVIAVLAEADELTGLTADPPEERAEIVEALMTIPPLFHAFWRDRAAGP